MRVHLRRVLRRAHSGIRWARRRRDPVQVRWQALGRSTRCGGGSVRTELAEGDGGGVCGLVGERPAAAGELADAQPPVAPAGCSAMLGGERGVELEAEGDEAARIGWEGR